MTNKEKYDSAFITVFEIDADQLTDQLKYQSIKAWDSVGHMALMAELEDLFDIMLEMDDVVDFGSYETGVKTLEKYGVQF
ncbi:acyl carrier protein [Rhodopseudomonas palustris]|uniref:acyl carrier protein n=1 Tax=Rhodopseudomonas palustris TaxID=1076 RepID=UPI0021F27975|nr:acyl carrier protein [Rhodopseudomonas palustris]UYO53633.1 acyl carrier protein [Rhodopseudomonas palustris]